MSVAADPQCVKPLVEGRGGGGFLCLDELGMHKLEGTVPGVGRSGVGMNLISSLPCTSTGAVPIVSGGDLWVVGNRDVVGDVGGQVPLPLMDGDQDVSLWANIWDGPASSCAMEPMS